MMKKNQGKIGICEKNTINFRNLYYPNNTVSFLQHRQRHNSSLQIAKPYHHTKQQNQYAHGFAGAESNDGNNFIIIVIAHFTYE